MAISRTPRRALLGVVVALSILAALYGGAPALVFLVYGKPSTAADFGNAFGFVSAFVSGLALVGVTYTLWQQQQLIRQGQLQLEVQKEELRNNTAMLGAQRDEMVRQNNYLARQEFENRFFRLLDSLHRMVEELRVEASGRIHAGRSALDYLADALRHHNRPAAYDRCHLRDTINDWYTVFYRQHGNELGHYFRMMYRLVLFIDRGQVPTEEKRFYGRILRAHLSQAELLLLFYNALSDYGYTKAPLINKDIKCSGQFRCDAV